MERRVGHMEIEARAPQARVPQQQLDAAQVDAGFEQMGREAMTGGVSDLLIWYSLFRRSATNFVWGVL